MKELDNFIGFITSIGFIKSISIDKIIVYSYDNYMIVINIIPDYNWAISINTFGDGDGFTETLGRGYKLTDIDLLKDIFKSELRNNKIKELGI